MNFKGDRRLNMKKRIYLVLLFLILLIFIIALFTLTKRTSQPLSKEGLELIRFKTISCIDREGIGIVAFKMLIPSEWVFDGGIRWILDNPGMPAVASFRVYNPNGKEEFEVLPNQAFFWTNNQMLLYNFPIGSRYFGNEVHPPVNSIDALKKIIIPRFRGNVTDLQIVDSQNLPSELVEAIRSGTPKEPGVSISADGAKIRIFYNRNGIPMEEEIYAVVEAFSYSFSTLSGMVTNTNWIIDYIFSFKAERGELDAQSKIFQTIAFSFKLNPQWFNKYTQVVEYLIQRQIQQIQSIGQLSRIISQTSNEISNMVMQSYNQRQAINDRIAENFSQYIRGVEEYYNPIENKTVELPAGYQNIWTNSLGEYILSDNPNFNPNIGSNINWQKIEKK